MAVGSSRPAYVGKIDDVEDDNDEKIVKYIFNAIEIDSYVKHAKRTTLRKTQK